jgi:hypothetical protein
MKQRWQYIWLYFWSAWSPRNINTTVNGIEYRGLSQCNELLDELGKNGWELTGVTTIGADFDSSIQIHMIFKRSTIG